MSNESLGKSLFYTGFSAPSLIRTVDRKSPRVPSGQALIPKRFVALSSITSCQRIRPLSDFPEM